jgi:hypothetical protein
MLMKTSHDLSIRFDIELFPRGSCEPPIAILSAAAWPKLCATRRYWAPMITLRYRVLHRFAAAAARPEAATEDGEIAACRIRIIRYRSIQRQWRTMTAVHPIATVQGMSAN